MEFFDLWQYWRLTLRLHGSMENPPMSSTGKQQKRPAMCHRVSTQVIMNTDLLSVWNHNSSSAYYISAVRCKQHGMLRKFPTTYFLWSVNESIMRVLSELSISGNSGSKYHENDNIPHCARICVTNFFFSAVDIKLLVTHHDLMVLWSWEVCCDKVLNVGWVKVWRHLKLRITNVSDFMKYIPWRGEALARGWIQFFIYIIIRGQKVVKINPS